MSTDLIQIEDDFGYVLEIYDSSGGCTLFVHKKDEETGIKFHVSQDAAEQIILAFGLSNHIENSMTMKNFQSSIKRFVNLEEN